MRASFTIFATGVILIVSFAFALSRNFLAKAFNWLVFSRNAAAVTLGIGGTWFLVNVLRMSVADFGEHRVALFALFATVILLAFFSMRELLAIRGLAISLLVYADFALTNIRHGAAYSESFFTSFIYLIIVLAMVIGAAPYLLRDFLEFLLKSKATRVSLAIFFIACGAFMCAFAVGSCAKFGGK